MWIFLRMINLMQYFQVFVSKVGEGFGLMDKVIIS